MRGININDVIVSSAYRLAIPRTIWGQSFDGSETVADTLFLCRKNNAGTNTSSARIRFNGFASNQHLVQGPSMEGINVGTYGAKRLAIFQHQAGGYTEEYEKEVVSILPNGNVGFGTTDPKKPVHIVGDIYVTGKVITDSGIEDNSQNVEPR